MANYRVTYAAPVVFAALAPQVACTWRVGSVESQPTGPAADGGITRGDARLGDGAPGPGDPALLAAAGCDSADPDLAACYAFENDTTDASFYGNHAVAAAVAYGPGVSGSALELSSASRVEVPDDASLQLIDRFTIELFFRTATALVAGERAMLIDKNYDYGIFFSGSGEISCAWGRGSASTLNAPITVTDRWIHFACTFDGLTTLIYVDGVEVAAQTIDLPIDVRSEALVIGADSPPVDPRNDSFVGRIDELRLWRIVRTPGQLCASAGACS